MELLGQKMAVAVAMVAAVAMMAAVARGQQTCVSKLVPCASYLHAANPPDSCCSPLKDAVTNELACLCAVYKEPNLLSAFNVTVADAVQLARRCGIDNTNLTACTTALAPGSNPPPATPGGNSGGSAHSATSFGISGLVSLFFFWWSVLA